MKQFRSNTLPGTNQTGNLSATFTSQDPDPNIDQDASSNSWTLTLKDAGTPDHILNGDFLAKTETSTGADIQRYNLQGQLVSVVKTGELYYLRDGQGNLLGGNPNPTYRAILDQDGHVIGQEEIPSDDETVTDNAIFGSAAKDKINGLTGNDILAGMAGNDYIKSSAKPLRYRCLGKQRLHRRQGALLTAKIACRPCGTSVVSYYKHSKLMLNLNSNCATK